LVVKNGSKAPLANLRRHADARVGDRQYREHARRELAVLDLRLSDLDHDRAARRAWHRVR
jgi:hypothetical protein